MSREKIDEAEMERAYREFDPGGVVDPVGPGARESFEAGYRAGFASAIKEIRAFLPSRQIDDDVGRIWNAYQAAVSERLDRMEQQ